MCCTRVNSRTNKKIKETIGFNTTSCHLCWSAWRVGSFRRSLSVLSSMSSILFSNSSFWSWNAFFNTARASASLCLVPRRFWMLSNSKQRWSAIVLQEVLCSELPLLRWYWALVRMPSRPMAVDSNVLTSWIASLRSFSSRSVCFLFILLVASTVCRSRRRVPDRELWLCTNSATWDRASCRLSTTWLASSNSWKQSSALPWRRWRSSARPRAPSFARWPCRLCSSPFLLSISAAWSWKGRERYWPLRYTMV